MSAPADIFRATLVAACMVPGIASPAQITPESGAYWDARRNGQGAYVEIQGGKVGVMFFTYDPDGSPVFYTAGGDLLSRPQSEQAIVGLYPMTVFIGDLHRSRNGPIFHGSSTGAGPLENGVVGRVEIMFGWGRSLILLTSLNPPVPTGLSREAIHVMARMNFGFEQFGRRVDFDFEPSCWPDLRGEWIFVDRTDPERPPWRFHFTTLEITPAPEAMVCRQPDSAPPQLLVYRDPGRGATLRCVYASPQMPDPVDGRPRSACDVRMDGDPIPLFWFDAEDAGLKRISASLGGHPPSTILRSEERVVGWRVE